MEKQLQTVKNDFRTQDTTGCFDEWNDRLLSYELCSRVRNRNCNDGLNERKESPRS